MAYATSNEMFEDLGLVMQYNRIIYSLLGETKQSEVVKRGVTPGSNYAHQMSNPVLAGGLLYDREDFHGTGTVLVYSVEAV